MLDFFAIFLSIVHLWWLIPVLFIILFLKSSFDKGLIGETLINFAINIHLTKDVTLPTEDGSGMSPIN